MTIHQVRQFVTKSADTDEGDDEDPIAEVTKAVAGLTETVEDRLTKFGADLAAERKRADELEKLLRRPGRSTGASDDEPSEERKAFGTYLRRGAGAGDAVLKTLKVSNDAQGGYLAPPEFAAEMIRNLVEFSPIRTVASVRTTGSPSVRYPKRTGVTNATWGGELIAQAASEPAFGQHEIPVREVNTYVDISKQLLADSGGMAEAEVRLALAEDFAKKEGAAFISGDNILAPEGMLTNSSVSYTANGHASNLSADALITLFYAIPAAWRQRGTWLMNATTVAAVRKLKDGTTGNYLWEQGYANAAPATILGRPVLECVDMPDPTSDLFPIIFGDIGTAYRIVDRIDLSILVNPFSRATEGVTRMHATKRVGAGVIQPTAIRKLKMATS